MFAVWLIVPLSLVGQTIAGKEIESCTCENPKPSTNKTTATLAELCGTAFLRIRGNNNTSGPPPTQRVTFLLSSLGPVISKEDIAGKPNFITVIGNRVITDTTKDVNLNDQSITFPAECGNFFFIAVFSFVDASGESISYKSFLIHRTCLDEISSGFDLKLKVTQSGNIQDITAINGQNLKVTGMKVAVENVGNVKLAARNLLDSIEVIPMFFCQSTYNYPIYFEILNDSAQAFSDKFLPSLINDIRMEQGLPLPWLQNEFVDMTTLKGKELNPGASTELDLTKIQFPDQGYLCYDTPLLVIFLGRNLSDANVTNNVIILRLNYPTKLSFTAEVKQTCELVPDYSEDGLKAIILRDHYIQPVEFNARTKGYSMLDTSVIQHIKIRKFCTEAKLKSLSTLKLCPKTPIDDSLSQALNNSIINKLSKFIMNLTNNVNSITAEGEMASKDLAIIKVILGLHNELLKGILEVKNEAFRQFVLKLASISEKMHRSRRPPPPPPDSPWDNGNGRPGGHGNGKPGGHGHNGPEGSEPSDGWISHGMFGKPDGSNENGFGMGGNGGSNGIGFSGLSDFFGKGVPNFNIFPSEPGMNPGVRDGNGNDNGFLNAIKPDWSLAGNGIGNFPNTQFESQGPEIPEIFGMPGMPGMPGMSGLPNVLGSGGSGFPFGSRKRGMQSPGSSEQFPNSEGGFGLKNPIGSDSSGGNGEWANNGNDVGNTENGKEITFSSDTNNQNGNRNDNGNVNENEIESIDNNEGGNNNNDNGPRRNNNNGPRRNNNNDVNDPRGNNNDNNNSSSNRNRNRNSSNRGKRNAEIEQFSPSKNETYPEGGTDGKSYIPNKFPKPEKPPMVAKAMNSESESVTKEDESSSSVDSQDTTVSTISRILTVARTVLELISVTISSIMKGLSSFGNDQPQGSGSTSTSSSYKMRGGGPGNNHHKNMRGHHRLSDEEEALATIGMQLYIDIKMGKSVDEITKQFDFLPRSFVEFATRVSASFKNGTSIMFLNPWIIYIGQHMNTENPILVAFTEMVSAVTQGYNNIPSGNKVVETAVLEFIDFLQKNASVTLKAYFTDQGMTEMIPLVDFSLKILKIIGDNVANLLNLSLKVGDNYFLNRKEFQLLRKEPGREPTDMENCERLVGRRMALVKKFEDKSIEEIKPFFSFENYVQKISRSKPFHWMKYKDAIYKGERSSIFPVTFWEKIALCACSPTVNIFGDPPSDDFAGNGNHHHHHHHDDGDQNQDNEYDTNDNGDGDRGRGRGGGRHQGRGRDRDRGGEDGDEGSPDGSSEGDNNGINWEIDPVSEDGDHGSGFYGENGDENYPHWTNNENGDNGNSRNHGNGRGRNRDNSGNGNSGGSRNNGGGWNRGNNGERDSEGKQDTNPDYNFGGNPDYKSEGGDGSGDIDYQPDPEPASIDFND